MRRQGEVKPMREKVVSYVVNFPIILVLGPGPKVLFFFASRRSLSWPWWLVYQRAWEEPSEFVVQISTRSWSHMDISLLLVMSIPESLCYLAVGGDSGRKANEIEIEKQVSHDHRGLTIMCRDTITWSKRYGAAAKLHSEKAWDPDTFLLPGSPSHEYDLAFTHDQHRKEYLR